MDSPRASWPPFSSEPSLSKYTIADWNVNHIIDGSWCRCSWCHCWGRVFRWWKLQPQERVSLAPLHPNKPTSQTTTSSGSSERSEWIKMLPICMNVYILNRLNMSTDQQNNCCRYNSLIHCKSCNVRCNAPNLAYTLLWTHMEACKQRLY